MSNGGWLPATTPLTRRIAGSLFCLEEVLYIFEREQTADCQLLSEDLNLVNSKKCKTAERYPREQADRRSLIGCRLLPEG